MGFSRNMNQKVTSVRRRQSIESPTSNKAPQKNMETMKILSNIKIPATMSVENQPQLWNANTQQNQGYFTNTRYENEWFQEGSQQQPGQGLPQTVTSTFETDIVDQAITAALEEVTQQNKKVNNEVTTEISEINALLVEPLSPWEDDHFVKPQSHVSAGNKKEKTTTKSKSCRPTEKEQSSKKQKLQDRSKNVTTSTQLMHLLKKEDPVQPPEINRVVPSASTTNIIPEQLITISDEDENTFSQDADITVIKRVKELKKNLIKNKEVVDSEFRKMEEEANALQTQIDSLKKQLTEVRECLSDMNHRRNLISEKLKLINEL